MNDRKLTHQQQRRAQENQRQRANKAQHQNRDLSSQDQSGQLGSEQRGLVISRYSREFDVEALEGEQQGQIFRCLSRTNLGGIVSGDEVIWRAGEGLTGVIESRLKRASILERPDNFGRLKPVAANIDQLLIVIAVQPAPQANLIDRYIVAAELMRMRPIILLNKVDLLDRENKSSLDDLLSVYQELGYAVLRIVTSRNQTPQLDSISKLIENRTSIVVGQSGVGKSSLINSLLPEAKLSIGKLSATSGEGTHTTTQARLFHLPEGGRLIDSPGIREFGLWHIDPEQVQFGFVEIANYLGQCRFRNCKHDNEPGCAVRGVVENKGISKQRFNSFRQIKASIEEQHAKGVGASY